MENGFVFDRKTIAREVRFDTVWQTKYSTYKNIVKQDYFQG